MNGKRDLDAFNKGQQNAQGSAKKGQDEVPSGRPEKVSKIVKTEPENNPCRIARSQDVDPKPDGLQPDGLAFPLDHPRIVESGRDDQCANCRLVGHRAYRCMGPWDPVRGTIKVCVLCNDASHGLDDCLNLKNDGVSKRWLLSKYLLIYRRGRPPIESSMCWVDLLSSNQYKESITTHPYVAERGYSPYPWTREFAISQHQNKPWDNYDYSEDPRWKWAKDPRTNSELALQKNLKSLRKTEPASAFPPDLRALARQRLMESESEREWELTTAGLKVWPDILAIAPMLKAYGEEEDN